MSFFHGVRTKQVASGSTTINTLPSCIIGLVGVSPVGPTQELVICNNDTDDAQFGEATPNNNIANTLAIIRSVVKGATGGDGSCAVVVVNVYATGHRAALNTTATPDATTGKCSLAKTIIGDLEDVEIKQGTTAVNEAAGGDYVFGEDYTLDRYGNFVDITGTYLGQVLTFAGTGMYYLNTGAVTGADIIGANTSGVRTGAKLFDECESEFEFKTKILLAPLYASLSGVQAALEAAATSYRGVWLSDAPSATSFTAALALRTTGQWATAVAATIPLFPWLKSYNSFANDDINYPYSAFMAGMLVATDNNAGGAWESPSNRQIPGVTGAQLRLTTGYNNPGSEINQLNAKGIVAYQKKSGYRTWGNRNAKFPSSGEVTNFINIYRMDCQVSDEMESALAEYNDKNITKSMIDSIKTTGNNYLKVLMQKGAVLPGSSIYFDPAKNSTTELANGHLVLTRKYMISTPAEQIEIENVLDIELFAALLK